MRKTIGIVEVAALAASAEGSPPVVAKIATGRRANSAAIAGSRSYWPIAQRYSIITFWPSTKPPSPRPRRNAATKSALSSPDRALRYPITGIAGCCACAAIGQAAAPPNSVMNSRRFMLIRSPRAAVDPAEIAHSLHEGGGPLALRRRAARSEQSDGRHLRLLRARRARPRRRAAKHGNEFSPPDIDCHATLQRGSCYGDDITPGRAALRDFGPA